MNLGLESILAITESQVDVWSAESLKQTVIDCLEAHNLCYEFDGHLASIMAIQQSCENLQSVMKNINDFGVQKNIQALFAKDLSAVSPSFTQDGIAKEPVLQELQISLEQAEAAAASDADSAKTGKMQAIKDFITKTWKRFKDFLSALWKRVSDAWANIKLRWDKIVKAGKDAFNWAKAKVLSGKLIVFSKVKAILMWGPDQLQEAVIGMVNGYFEGGGNLTGLNKKFAFLKWFGLELTETGLHFIEKPEDAVAETTPEKAGWTWESVGEVIKKYSGYTGAKEIAAKIAAEAERKMQERAAKSNVSQAEVSKLGAIIQKICTTWARFVAIISSTCSVLTGMIWKSKKEEAK